MTDRLGNQETGDDRGVGTRGDIAVLVFAMAFPTLAAWLYFVVLAGTTWMH